MKFENNSTRNEFGNNVIVGVRIDGSKVAANPSAVLMEVDGTVGENTYRSNLYVSGRVEGRNPDRQETGLAEFSSNWFAKFAAALNRNPGDFKPSAEAPFLGKGALSPTASSGCEGASARRARRFGPDHGAMNETNADNALPLATHT